MEETNEELTKALGKTNEELIQERIRQTIDYSAGKIELRNLIIKITAFQCWLKIKEEDLMSPEEILKYIITSEEFDAFNYVNPYASSLLQNNCLVVRIKPDTRQFTFDFWKGQGLE
jgi:hypothetical protein